MPEKPKDNVVKFVKRGDKDSSSAKSGATAGARASRGRTKDLDERQTAGLSNSALADEKVAQALESKGRKRVSLAKEALALDPDCTDAYMILASDEKNEDKVINLYRQAVASATKSLPENWKTRFKGHFWGVTETRPLMQAMASLAMALQWADQLDEALALYRELMELNPNDNQGIRYQLAGCLYEAHCDEELDDLLSTYANDPSAAFLYTKALHVFRKNGANNLSSHTLMKAYNANKFVPLFLSDIIEMPDEPPFSIGFGDDTEAIAYAMDNGYMWDDTEGAMTWLADTLEMSLRRDFDDKEMINDVLDELRLIEK